MWKASLGLAFLCMYLDSTRGININSIDFAHKFFTSNRVAQVTSAICWDNGKVLLHKKFSGSGVRINNLNLEKLESAAALVSHLTSRYSRLGIFIDLKCVGTKEILEIANENGLFIQANSLATWLVIFGEHVPEDVLKTKAGEFQPEILDPIHYLLKPHKDTKNSNVLIEITKSINANFIKRYEEYGKPKPSNLSYSSDIDHILPLNILLDNRVILAVPGNGKLYDLYNPYRVTKESKMKIIKTGTVFAVGEETELVDVEIPERKNLEGALLRAVTAIYSPEKFTGLEDVSTRDIDAWAKMGYSIIQLLQDGLNFSIIIRVFDDYGWKRNNTFTTLMGNLEKREADLSAAGLLFREERYQVLDYLNSPFRLQTSILFREPSLSSVTNIFLSPFSPALWICVLLLMILIMAALFCELTAGKYCRWHDSSLGLTDIVFFVLAAAGQQGYNSTPVSATGRIIFFVLLFACVALFTAFAAKIVAVMQSFSTSILTIQDLTESNFEVGIQANFPIFDVAFKDAEPNHKIITEFYRRKILSQKGNAHIDPKIGIEKIRRGLFAYEVDLTVGYKIISDTYEEIDKCGLKQIDVFPKPYLGTALQKNSPFRETFRRRLLWNAEIGMMTRAWKRWIPQKPKCEAERIGFISVGFTESFSAIMFFLYGFAASISVFLLEIIYHKITRK